MVEDDDEIDLDTLIDDVRGAQKRAQKATYLEAKNELATNVYPIIEMLVQKLRQHENLLGNVLEQTESFIQTELASDINSVLQIGAQLANLILGIQPGVPIDPTGLQQLKQIAGAYLQAAQAVAESVENVAVPGDEEEVEDDEDDEDEDEDEDDEQIAAESTPTGDSAQAKE